MRKKWILTIAGILVVVGVSAVAVGPVMSDVETPDYDVVSSDGAFEVRQYPPIIIAEVTLDGSRKDAIGDGFRLLADYIFGNNKVKQDIAMTAPVQQQKSTEIAMTAPVQQQSSGDEWTVSFVMPSKYSMETLPDPVNQRVSLKQVPAKKYVVITFAGTTSDENVQEHEEKLKTYITDNSLSVFGPPKYAFYNPPWTLPSMRRNEVMMEIQD
ncbi:SOUL family heme-binding protein [Thalassospira lucentensis]|uniref:SOUL family heme-binding protein n=1 Tax=Thalassospira lucentensis TaxID=168935 RepID=UPI001C37DB81|nr:heme-binding protein [Thalassospira lucentensis]